MGTLVGIIIANQAAITKQLGDWRLLHEPERLTELYFTDYTQLPKSLTVGTRQVVTFTVRNLEHQAATYHYKIVAKPDEGAEQPLSNGTFILNHEESHLGSTDIVVPPAETRVAIKVELYYQSITPSSNSEGVRTQSINYWAAVVGASSSKATL